VLAVCAALAPATAHTAGRAPTTGALGSSLLAEINDVRASHGLVAVHPSAALLAAARQHSEEMVASSYFDHASPDGSAFWLRVQRFYPQRGSGTWSVGENLLWSTGSLDAKRAVELWLESPGHRRILLTARWRELGLGIVRVSGAPGPWGEGPVTIVTADFGVRS